jgi:hypothetical protein
MPTALETVLVTAVPTTLGTVLVTVLVTVAPTALESVLIGVEMHILLIKGTPAILAMIIPAIPLIEILLLSILNTLLVPVPTIHVNR